MIDSLYWIRLRRIPVVPILLVGFLPGPATASWCSAVSPTANMRINLGTISEGTSNPVAPGSTIYTLTGAWDAYGGHNAGRCSSSLEASDRIATRVDLTMPGAPVAGYANVYPTNLTGVGVRISVWSSLGGYYGTPTTPTPLPYTLTANLQDDPINLGPAYGTGHLQVKVEVIKTAPNWQAGILNWTGGNLQVRAVDGGSNTVVYTAINIAGVMKTRACSLNMPNNLTVSLGTASYPAGFTRKGVGATAPPKPFAIAMHCESGPKTAIRFDAPATQENPDIIALTPGGATGVGVQLLDRDGNPVSLGTWIPLADAAPDGLNTLTFKGRYYVTDWIHLRPGKANAIATFSMAYE